MGHVTRSMVYNYKLSKLACQLLSYSNAFDVGCLLFYNIIKQTFLLKEALILNNWDQLPSSFFTVQLYLLPIFFGKSIGFMSILNVFIKVPFGILCAFHAFKSDYYYYELKHVLVCYFMHKNPSASAFMSLLIFQLSDIFFLPLEGTKLWGWCSSKLGSQSCWWGSWGLSSFFWPLILFYLFTQFLCYLSPATDGQIEELEK